MRALWVAGLVAAIGCKQAGPGPAVNAPVAKSSAPAGPTTAAGSSSGSALVQAAQSHEEQDRLWAMAPEHATLGVVVSPRGLALAERAAVAFTELMGSSPDFAQPNSAVMHQLLQRS